MIKVTLIERGGKLEFFANSQEMFEIIVSNLWATISLEVVILTFGGVEYSTQEEYPDEYLSLKDIYQLGNHVNWNAPDELDQLASAGKSGLPWICRMSTSGRGLRLHQTTAQDYHELACERTHPTPRAAIEAFMEKFSGLPEQL